MLVLKGSSTSVCSRRTKASYIQICGPFCRSFPLTKHEGYVSIPINAMLLFNLLPFDIQACLSARVTPELLDLVIGVQKVPDPSDQNMFPRSAGYCSFIYRLGFVPYQTDCEPAQGVCKVIIWVSSALGVFLISLCAIPIVSCFVNEHSLPPAEVYSPLTLYSKLFCRYCDSLS